jgi:hypothetical protein
MSETLGRLVGWVLGRESAKWSGHRNYGAEEDEMAIPVEVYFSRPHNKNLQSILPDEMVNAIKAVDDKAEERYSEIDQHVTDLRTVREHIAAKKKRARKQTRHRRRDE